MSTSRPDTAFLFDVDDTLLNNNRAIADLFGILKTPWEGKVHVVRHVNWP